MPVKQFMTFYENYTPKSYMEEMDGERIVFEEYDDNGEVIRNYKKIFRIGYTSYEEHCENGMVYTGFYNKDAFWCTYSQNYTTHAEGMIVPREHNYCPLNCRP